jgi:hypothetical protein
LRFWHSSRERGLGKKGRSQMRMKNMWFVGALVMAAIAPTRAAADSAGLAATSLSLAPQGERRHY